MQSLGYLDEDLEQRKVCLEKSEAVLIGQRSKFAVLDDEVLHGARPLVLQVLVSAERQDVLVVDGAGNKLGIIFIRFMNNF